MKPASSRSSCSNSVPTYERVRLSSLTFQKVGSVSVTRSTHERSAARRPAIDLKLPRLGSGRPGPNGSRSKTLRLKRGVLGCGRTWVGTLHGRLRIWYLVDL